MKEAEIGAKAEELEYLGRDPKMRGKSVSSG